MPFKTGLLCGAFVSKYMLEIKLGLQRGFPRSIIFSTPWTIDNTICNTILFIQYVRRRPAMHIEGFNMHALEGAIHFDRSISFVAVAAMCFDKPISFWRAQQYVSY